MGLSNNYCIHAKLPTVQHLVNIAYIFIRMTPMKGEELASF